MFDFADTKNLEKEYKDFIILKIEDLPEQKAKGIYLRHKTTGLEVYHIYCQDKENLFSLAFRTYAKNNMGCAHIMEHSVLCGSEKFPIKEPYTTLASQSINTYINAITYPDKTVFPASSLVRSDYFNMMDVYLDAVFFPKLEENTFLQEGHRLEFKNNELSIQGVVYNEMKGSYSSFYQVAFSKLINSMFPSSYASFDSGGDPLEIPNLSYKDFLQFHKTFYAPDNCLLFLYGNIPITEQIDYLSTNYIPRLQKKFNQFNVINNYKSILPLVKNEVLELQEIKLRKQKKYVKTQSCESGATGNFVTRNWYVGEYTYENFLLAKILFGNDSSPISKILKESGLGDDLQNGLFGQFPQQFIMLGLCGVKKGDENKVFELIEKAVLQVYNEPFNQKDIDSAVMGIDYSLREINRYYGPVSVALMEKVLKSWTIGKDCSTKLNSIADFEKTKNTFAKNQEQIKKLFKKIFIDSKVYVDYVCEPSELFLKQRQSQEKKIIQQLRSKITSVDQITEQNNKLHKAQQRKETQEELKCISHTKISELDLSLTEMNEIKLEFIQNKYGENIPIFFSPAKTNGVLYIDVCFPFDSLDAKYFQYIPFLSDLVSNLGWNNKPWDECLTHLSCVMGDMSGGMIVGSVPTNKECIKESKKYKKYNFIDRLWLCMSAKSLVSQKEDTLKLFSQIITTVDFKDTKRLKTLINELVSDSKANFVPDGRSYAGRITKSCHDFSSTLAEILFGLSQLNTIKSYKNANPKELFALFSSLYKEITSNGGILHICADSSDIESIRPLLKDFVNNTNIRSLSKPRKHSVKEMLPYVYNSKIICNEFSQSDIKVPCQTGYAALSFPSANYMTKEYSAQLVLSNWLNSHSLWEKLRTTGGAYGAFCEVDGTSQLFTMTTYRDPSPEASLNVFIECIQELQNKEFEQEEIEKIIVSLFAEKICPDSPRQMARDSFEFILYGNSNQLNKKRVEMFLSITPQDIHNIIPKILVDIKKYCKKSVFCDKKIKTSGNILQIPL